MKNSKTIKIFIVAIVVILVSFFVSRIYSIFFNVNSCESLYSIANQASVQSALRLWVKDDLAASLSMGDYRYGGGVVPGHFRIDDMGFDWSVLEMDKDNSQIRVITEHKKDGSIDTENIQSISFTERSRVSILVRPAESQGFGVTYESDLTKVTPDIAVFCARNQSKMGTH